jgi:hypothetical protein
LGKAITKDITLDFVAMREAECKKHVSYGAFEDEVWEDMKKTPLISASWDPVMNGAKAEYVEDIDAVRIWIPANCTQM